MVYTFLSQMKHGNGNKACVLYSGTDFNDSLKQGPIVTFNLLRLDGRMVGYHEVEKLASVYHIHLRTGCFCNTGACMKYLALNSEQIRQHLEVSACTS